MLPLAFLTYAAIAAAVVCPIRPNPEGFYDCFHCPAVECGSKVRNTITPGLKRDVSCLWTDGGTFLGINDWYYVPSEKCYIWGGRIDTGACALGTINTCGEACQPQLGTPTTLPKIAKPPKGKPPKGKPPKGKPPQN